MSYLNFAKRLAVEAGKIILENMNQQIETESKTSGKDLVTEVDRMVEQFIQQELTTTFPDHQMLGEEEAFASEEMYKQILDDFHSIPFIWVVDPIDGTNNFIQNIPGFVVSIALVSYGKPIVGVIYDPIRNELFYATENGGAYLNEKKINVAHVDHLNGSVIGTSFSSVTKIRSLTVKNIEMLLPKCRTIRVLGAAALNLAYVAKGRITSFYHFELNPWDVAAGILIISEAGGKVTTMKGTPYELSKSSILVSNGFIHQQMLDTIHS